MENILPSLNPPGPVSWRAVVLPKEHGSWSLALEPLAIGLLAAPSVPGAALALAVASAFLARRPLRVAAVDARPERRRVARGAFAICTLIAASGLGVATALAGWAWTAWLIPAAAAGAVFLSFDLRNEGRAEAAEVAGATAFALLPAALGVLGGQTAPAAMALAAVMLGRAVPTVLCVRASLRALKTGVLRPVPALASALAAALAAVALVRAGLASAPAVVALGLLALRAFAWLVFPRPVLRGRTLGMIEAALGVAFVVAVGATWPA